VKYLHRTILVFTLAIILFCVSGDAWKLAANDLIHVVGKGETVYSISRFYRISVDELMKANKITDPSKLQAGSRIVIPSSAFSDVSVSTGNIQVLTDYRVARGDTLYGIARANGISLQTLLDINKFSPNHVLKIDDIVKVPAQPSANTASANTAGSSSAATGVYSLRWPVAPKDIAYMTGQTGVVVEGEYNEAVRSLTQGRVISAGPWRKFGRVVIVETSGGYFYMYGGCEILSVNIGDRITPGTELGKLGVNAVSDKPQLFFMVFRSDTPIDPALAPRA
jgi:murein DD-endopeptidase MepM/ murein hydrolase activator NlpD